MLIPPTFPYLPTYTDWTLGELKIGHSLERNCPSSVPDISNAPSHWYRGTAAHIYDGATFTQSFFPNS